MKKLLPFVFPLAALLIIVLLIVRWYSPNTTRPEGVVGQGNEGIEIENLSTADQERILKGSGDFKKVDLQGNDAAGTVRYEIKEDKVVLSVMADLPELPSGKYQVWSKKGDKTELSKAFVLVMSKGGWQGSASLKAEELPVEVVVSSEKTDDNTLESEVFRGTITK